MPGIIDAHSHIAVEGSVNEGSVSVSSMVGVEDVLDPEDIDIYRALAGGVTTSNVLHGSANAIGGKNQVIKLRWGKDAQGARRSRARCRASSSRSARTRSARTRRARRADRALSRHAHGRDGHHPRGVRRGAASTSGAWDDYRARAGEGRGRASPPRRDLKLEPLVEVLEGKRLVHAHCYRADEILQLLRVAEEFGFRIATLQHVLEGYRVADEIAKHGAGASTFSDWWAYKVEAYEAIPYNAALMTERGVSSRSTPTAPKSIGT